MHWLINLIVSSKADIGTAGINMSLLQTSSSEKNIMLSTFAFLEYIFGLNRVELLNVWNNRFPNLPFPIIPIVIFDIEIQLKKFRV